MVFISRGSFNQWFPQPGVLSIRASYNQGFLQAGVLSTSLYTRGLLQTGVVTLRVLTSRDLLDCKTVGFFSQNRESVAKESHTAVATLRGSYGQRSLRPEVLLSRSFHGLGFLRSVFLRSRVF